MVQDLRGASPPNMVQSLEAFVKLLRLPVPPSAAAESIRGSIQVVPGSAEKEPLFPFRIANKRSWFLLAGHFPNPTRFPARDWPCMPCTVWARS
jgi:hypothetical protein